MTRLKDILDGFDLADGDRLPIPVDELHSFEPFAIRRKDVPNITFGWTMNVPRRLSDDESQAMGMLNHILNGTLHSRIFGEARKKGLVYGIWSETSAYEHNSSWDFGAEVNAEKIDELFEVIVKEIVQIKNGEISDDELQSAKSFALGQHQIGVQTVGRLNNWLSDFYFLDGRIEDFASQPDKINAVTKQKIIDVTNEFISTRCWGVGIYGKTNKALADELKNKLDKIYE
jgi:predicted Zn-dependent peptidase